MSDGNWMMGCVVLSHCDLCPTSHCSLKTIYCRRCKPAVVELEMVGGQNREERWRGCRNERLKDGYETVLITRKKRKGSMEG